MLYNDLLKQAQENIREIAKTYHNKLKEKLPNDIGARGSLAENLPAISELIQMELRYLETNDYTEFQQYIATAVANLIEQGQDYVESSKAGLLLTETLTDFFRERLSVSSDPDAASTLQLIERRMRGLIMVARSVTTSTGIKNLKKGK